MMSEEPMKAPSPDKPADNPPGGKITIAPDYTVTVRTVTQNGAPANPVSVSLDTVVTLSFTPVGLDGALTVVGIVHDTNGDPVILNEDGTETEFPIVLMGGTFSFTIPAGTLPDPASFPQLHFGAMIAGSNDGVVAASTRRLPTSI